MRFVFHLKIFLVTLAAYLTFDLLWVGVIAQRFYQDQLGSLMSPSVTWLPVFLFYLLFTACLLTFVIVPGRRSGSLRRTLLLGALFGLVTYGTYDLINAATIRNWPALLTVVDMAWGACVSAGVSGIGYAAARQPA